MSYQVLARKYRPHVFSEVIGQTHVVQALTHALEQQRLHHAWLFTGTRGIGKTTIARILAKALNCTGPDGQGGITATPCGQCAACRQIDGGSFVDYTELDAASNRGVDEVQGLLEQAVYKPVLGRFKVFMIDEVHMLTNTAFNAMLKTLEEPPEYLKFVLATTDPQKIPVTVLSRCLQFNLRPIAPEVIVEQLQQVLQQEAVAAEPQALALIARAARGSMRDALSLTDQAVAYGAGKLQAEAVRQMLGSADRSHVFALLQALAAGDGAAVMEGVEALRVRGESAAATLDEMAAVLQRVAVLKMVPEAGADPADPDREQLQELARRLPADEIHLLYSLCIHGREELPLAPDEYVGLTMAVLRLLPFRQDSEPTEAAPPAEKKTLQPPPRPAPATAPPPLEAQATGSDAAADGPDHAEPAESPQQPDRPDVSAGIHPESVPAEPVGTAAAEPAAAGTPELADFWCGLVQELIDRDAVSALVRELALQSQLVQREEQVWTLRVQSQSLARSAAVQRLQEALAEQGQSVRLTVQVGPVEDNLARRTAERRRQRLQAAEELLLADPYVQELMRDFGATIVPDSIEPL